MFFIIYEKTKPTILLLLVFINLFIKIIPIYLLYKEPIRVIPNIVTIIAVVIVYELYLESYGYDMLGFYAKILHNLIMGKSEFINSLFS